jgi:hypothetical protein
MTDGRVDAIFDAIARRRRLARLHNDIIRPEFWRSLNPQLTITDEPFAPRVVPRKISHADALIHADFLQEEGYLQAPPLFTPEEVEPLRLGVQRVVDAGLPSGMAWLYDEFYLMLASVAPVLEPMLGDAPLIVPEDFWIFYVPPGTVDRTGFGPYGPHRDYWVDPWYARGERPRVLAAWIPLTDVTPLDSCLYVVHPQGDPDFASTTQEVRPDTWAVTDIRALPAPAGSVLAFGSRIAHWGSRSSRFATGPRISLACGLQHRDVPPFGSHPIDPAMPLPWKHRLDLVLDTIGRAGR